MHFTNIAMQKLGPNTILGTRPPKYNTQNMHYHVRNEYTLPTLRYTSAGIVAGITLPWTLTKRESITQSTKPEVVRQPLPGLPQRIEQL